jgi:hypothetical protein
MSVTLHPRLSLSVLLWERATVGCSALPSEMDEDAGPTELNSLLHLQGGPSSQVTAIINRVAIDTDATSAVPQSPKVGPDTW